MIIWYRAQLVVVDKSYMQSTPKIVFDVRAPLRVTRGVERTFSRPFSETFRISKNDDFNSPYLESENEFFKNSFRTVFRASKSRDRGQLASAFQFIFKKRIFMTILKLKVAFHERKFEFKVFRNIHLNDHNF